MTTTLTQAIATLYDTIAARPIAGVHFDLERQRADAIERIGAFRREVFSGRWERGWGSGCSLTIRRKESEYQGQEIWTLECEISWSSTSRGIVSALCAATLYREVIELAAYLEHQWGNVERKD